MFASTRASAVRAFARPLVRVGLTLPRVSAFSTRLLSLSRVLAFSRPVTQSRHRFYTVLTQSAAKEYKYEDIKAIASSPESHPDTLIIDVREPAEFQEGHIPGAHNVPFKSSPGAFDMPEEDFAESFGFEKPAKDKNLVFYCLGGVRLTAAEELANSFGYAKRGNYIGSWEDWVSHELAKH